MDCLVNSESIQGQFTSDTEAYETLKNLYVMMREANKDGLNVKVFIPRELPYLYPVNGKSFADVIGNHATRDEIAQIRAWLSKSGPFWHEADIAEFPKYIYKFCGLDVTSKPIGAAARLIANGGNSCLFSFPKSSFNINPISVSSSSGDLYDIDNFDSAAAVVASPKAKKKEVCSWVDLLPDLKEKFPLLDFMDNCTDSLFREPFVKYVTYRVDELLSVVSNLQSARDTGDEKKFNEIFSNHCTNDGWFSDESSTNIAKFESALRFGGKLYSYHGKIQTPPYRIHFDWPLVKDVKPVVAYIGPKLTKS